MARKRLALVIAAHNESLVIANTINSAIDAGLERENIFVVDDVSDDGTYSVAAKILARDNVLKLKKRSGKGLALTKAFKKFALTEHYRWVHIADADGMFSPGYFTTLRSKLRVKYAAATGYVQSLPGYSVSNYRVYEYTLGMEITRRFQSLFGVISVIPGPSSIFRSDVLENISFNTGSLTEDFDATLQLYRKKLGRIQFIPQIKSYTQDPQTLKDYRRQISRWYRGILEVMQKHHIGWRLTKIDAYLSYQIVQNLIQILYYAVALPLMAVVLGRIDIIALFFLYDVAIMFLICFLTAARSGRFEIIFAFASMYMIRWLSLTIFAKEFIRVAFINQIRPNKPNKKQTNHWESAQRSAIGA